ncbi:MAG: T9SS type A sorting domain-containing protein [bacterium]|nr:T9SS type A sorting domain-containing protein [bacterium]
MPSIYGLTSVFATSNNSAWVSGHFGTIAVTFNRGNSWQRPASFVTSNSIYTVEFVDQITGWASGSFGSVYKTLDGGVTWQTMKIDTTEIFFDQVFIDENIGWVGGSTLYYTTSGGCSWNEVILPFAEKVVSMSRAGENGIMVGLESNTDRLVQLFRINRNRPDSLLVVGGPFTFGLQDLSFSDINHGCIVGSRESGGGVAFTTEDGGATWNESHDSLQGLFGICSDQIGGWLVCGVNGYVAHQSIGSSEWIELQVPTEENLVSASIGTTGDYWVCGGGGAVLYASVSDSTWQAANDTMRNTLYDCKTSASGTTILVGDGGLVMHGNNMRGALTSTIIDGFPQLTSVAERVPNEYWCSSTGGVLFHSANAFGPWTAMHLPTQSPLTIITFAGPDFGYVAGYGGTLFSTSNGGISWMPQEIDANVDFSAMCFISDSVGWIGGGQYLGDSRFEGKLFNTIDAGNSWSLQLIDTTDFYGRYFTAVVFVSSAVGWATATGSNGGAIYHSTDRGNHWFKQFEFRESSLLTIEAISESHAIAIGGRGNILETRDGGESWIQIESPTESALRGLSVSNTRSGLMCGDGGVVIGLNIPGSSPEPPELLSSSMINLYPNPCNSSLTVEYQVPYSGHVEIIIYNLNGQAVMTLVSENQYRGVYLQNRTLTSLSSGPYFVRGYAPGWQETKKLALLK